MLQSICLSTSYVLGRILSKVDHGTENEKFSVYFSEVRGKNFTIFSPLFSRQRNPAKFTLSCRREWKVSGQYAGDIDQKSRIFKVCFHGNKFSDKRNCTTWPVNSARIRVIIWPAEAIDLPSMTPFSSLFSPWQGKKREENGVDVRPYSFPVLHYPV